MTSPLRSFLQFTPLERKLRQVAGKSDWRERIKSLAGGPLLEYETAKAGRWGIKPPDAGRLKACLDVVASPANPEAGLSEDDLLHFQDVLDAGEGKALRHGTAPRLAEAHVCLEPAAIPRALARFFEWTASQAFSEMHALEQMTLCQVRLYEIWPFQNYSGLTADFFSLRVLYLKTSLLPLFKTEEIDDFQEALSEAFAFVTKPLVDFYPRACERTCDQVIGQP